MRRRGGRRPGVDRGILSCSGGEDEETFRSGEERIGSTMIVDLRSHVVSDSHSEKVKKSTNGIYAFSKNAANIESHSESSIPLETSDRIDRISNVVKYENDKSMRSQSPVVNPFDRIREQSLHVSHLSIIH